MGPCVGITGVDTPVECDGWLKIAVQTGLSAPLRCRDEFATHYAGTFLGRLRRTPSWRCLGAPK